MTLLDFAREDIVPGMVVLRGRADAAALMPLIHAIAARAPFRHMQTAGGRTLNVALTNCGALGWTSDRRGYRYRPDDPETGLPWPAMPDAFRTLGVAAAAEAGWAFEPDSCLINRYAPGMKLSAHQDRNEAEFAHPIVSVSLGLPARFFVGGLERGGPMRRFGLFSGDVMVWGGPARLLHHGVDAIRPGIHPVTGAFRYNVTFRRAGPAGGPAGGRAGGPAGRP